jgi:hypothetical protein
VSGHRSFVTEGYIEASPEDWPGSAGTDPRIRQWSEITDPSIGVLERTYVTRRVAGTLTSNLPGF